jgi:hypothetical protein
MLHALERDTIPVADICVMCLRGNERIVQKETSAMSQAFHGWSELGWPTPVRHMTSWVVQQLSLSIYGGVQVVLLV